MSIACDKTPRILDGFMLQTKTPRLSCSCSCSTKPARPLTTVLGASSPKSTVSTNRLSASGCCRPHEIIRWQCCTLQLIVGVWVQTVLNQSHLFDFDDFPNSQIKPGWYDFFHSCSFFYKHKTCKQSPHTDRWGTDVKLLYTCAV